MSIWQTGPPGPEPFTANRIATGTGCVALHRQSGSVSTEVIGCPPRLVQAQPDSTDGSWGRDSEAMRRAAVLIDGSIDQELRWEMTKDPGGMPRSTPRTSEQVIAAVNRTATADGEGFVLRDVQQQGRSVTGLVTAHASGMDPVDTGRTVQASACARMMVDLDDVHPNFLFTHITCGAR